MTASLPPEVQAVFSRFVTTEYTTIDGQGHPITWPVTPFYSLGDPCIDVTTDLGYPKKAHDARANAKVALLFSDPAGSGLEKPPMVLVQGSADVDDRDLDANRERYERESQTKLAGSRQAPEFLQRFLAWYFTRIYIHVRPERIFAWPEGEVSREPALYGSHMEEVRSGHSEEPDVPHAEPEGGPLGWDARLDELGSRYRTAVVSLVAPDGFPFAARLPVRVDRAAGRVQLEGEPVGLPLQPGVACLTVQDPSAHFSWQRHLQIRGDLVPDPAGWSLVPHQLVGGLELSRLSTLQRYRVNIGNVLRFRRTAKREYARRTTSA